MTAPKEEIASTDLVSAVRLYFSPFKALERDLDESMRQLDKTMHPQSVHGADNPRVPR